MQWTSTNRPGIDDLYRTPAGTLHVLFGAGRVVGLSTKSPRFRTAGRIGVGSPAHRVVVLPGFTFNGCTEGWGRITETTDTNFYMTRFGNVSEVSVSRRPWVTC